MSGVMQLLKILAVMSLLIVMLVSPVIAFAGAVMTFRLRVKHRLFLHMAALKLGMALGFSALVISEVIPGAKGFQIHLNGWHGWWFVGGLLAMVLPLIRMVLYLLGIMRNGNEAEL